MKTLLKNITDWKVNTKRKMKLRYKSGSLKQITDWIESPDLELDLTDNGEGFRHVAARRNLAIGVFFAVVAGIGFITLIVVLCLRANNACCWHDEFEMNCKKKDNKVKIDPNMGRPTPGETID